MLIPSQAVIFNKDGLSAAVVSNGKVELRKLELEADNGVDVEVRIGLRPGDRVILSPRRISPTECVYKQAEHGTALRFDPCAEVERA